MPLDAICLTGIVRELRQEIVGLRVEKVQQPARDQVILTLRGNKKLLLCAGANQARIHLTALSRENPAAPPMFCMLLRKHLGGGRIADIRQPGLERAVILELDIVDELGEPGRRSLAVECMGRYSNLILLDGEGRIIDCPPPRRRRTRWRRRRGTSTASWTPQALNRRRSGSSWSAFSACRRWSAGRSPFRRGTREPGFSPRRPGRA